jgi:hypothetical protein
VEVNIKMKKSIILFSGLVLLLFMCSSVFALTTTIRPDGQGYYSAWSNTGCSSGSSEWQCVDENPANTSDYLYTSSKNVAESFTFGNTGFTTQTINSVTLYYYAKYYSSSRYRIYPLIRTGSTDYLGSAKDLGSGYAYASQVYSTNPATGSAWTIAEVDGLQAGMKTNSNYYGAYVAQVYAVVDYSIPNSCSDTDGGNIIATFGNVSGYLNSSYYANSDYCVDSSNIMEYYCSGTSKQSSQQSCGTDAYGSDYCGAGNTIYKDLTDYFCASGECDSSVTPQLQQDCDDGDGYDANYCSADSIYRDFNDYFCASGACDYTTTQELVETCDGDGYGSNYCSGDLIYKDYTDNFCANGACDSSATPVLQDNCNNYDYNGSNYCYNGSVYRDFNNYFCASGACSYSATQQLVQFCSYGCTAGVCNPQYSCSDSDGGFTFIVKGTVSGYFYGYPYSVTDFCSGNTTLVEYYCAGNYKYNYTTSCAMNGTTMCSSGACV